MNQTELDKYFSTVWHSNLDQYQYSGWKLISKIHKDETVLDVGCGYNEFKQHIKNLIGIDPANENADVMLSIENFRKDIKFDVAFCLGSINFGNEEIILNQIDCVVQCLKPQARIYWRCNPGLKDHGNQECEKIDFFPWSFEKHLDYSKKFGFTCQTLAWDSNNRIYSEWTRQSSI